MSRTKRTQKQPFPSREKFNELLLAAYNIGPEVEPGDITGVNYNVGAMETATELYDLLESRESLPGYADGVIVAITLFSEVTSNKNPVAYTQQEIERGFNGDR